MIPSVPKHKKTRPRRRLCTIIQDTTDRPNKAHTLLKPRGPRTHPQPQKTMRPSVQMQWRFESARRVTPRRVGASRHVETHLPGQAMDAHSQSTNLFFNTWGSTWAIPFKVVRGRQNVSMTRPNSLGPRVLQMRFFAPRGKKNKIMFSTTGPRHIFVFQMTSATFLVLVTILSPPPPPLTILNGIAL